MKNGKVPSHLSSEAKKIWKKLTSDYDISDSGGLSILRAGLEAFDRAQKARASLDKIGLMIKDRFGGAKPHPLIQCERDSRAAFLQALKMLNLDILPLRDKPGRPGS